MCDDDSVVTTDDDVDDDDVDDVDVDTAAGVRETVPHKPAGDDEGTESSGASDGRRVFTV